LPWRNKTAIGRGPGGRYRPAMAQKILVVDDDKDIQRLLALRLGSAGYETAFASDGITAISAARQQAPDLIVLDLGLPAGDGFSVLERLQALPQLASIPVIVLTARESPEARARALEAGVERFVAKPFESEALLEAIAAALSA
jgi:CheY-like chemotaxis protein